LVDALRRRRSLRAGLVQLVYVLGGIALGLLVPKLDVGASIPSVEAATLLAGTTAGLLALIGIVFALLFLVIQFAATAQSPRLHLFRDNPLVWHALGLVVGVIVYATTCVVVTADDPTTTVLVPISVLILALLAVALTRRLQLAALQSVQLSATLDQVTSRTREVIDRLYPAPLSQSQPQPQPQSRPQSQPPPAAPAAPVQIVQIRWPAKQGYLRQIDLPQLIRAARQADAAIRLLVLPGDLVRENAVVLEFWDARAVPEAGAVLKYLEVGIDRNFNQDPLLGFRLLNDIALRAMSAAINDPASVIQAIDSIESLLTVLVQRDLAIGLVMDDANTARVIFNAHDWADFLAAGVDEIAQTPRPPMVDRRLRAMLEQVLSVAPERRRPSIEQRMAELPVPAWPAPTMP
jgi:uncharacterized membrane protein